MGPDRSVYSDFAAEQFRLALDALAWNWGEAYIIRVAGGEWSAERRDDGKVLRAGSAEDLREAIFADYSARPVPRDAVHSPAPVRDTAYTMEGPRTGKLLDERFTRCWPAEGICSCDQVVRKESADEPWVHTGRKPGGTFDPGPMPTL